MAGVDIRAVHKHFGSTHVIRGVDIAIADGEFCVLVGPSGCGKSTLLRMIAGLEEIGTGEIAIGSTVVNRVPPKERDIAMVFQNYALYPHMTVRHNMSFALMLAKRSKSDIAAQRHNLIQLHRVQTGARALGAPAVDRPTGEIEVAPSQSRHLRSAQPVPVGEQDHRVVARTLATLLRAAKECCDFVSGEVIAEAWFAGHAYKLSRTPSPASPRGRTRVTARKASKKAYRPYRTEPLPPDRFSGRNSQPNAQRVARRSHEAMRPRLIVGSMLPAQHPGSSPIGSRVARYYPTVAR